MRSTAVVRMALVSLVVLLVGTAACELPTFTPVFTVNIDGAAADAQPGDGVCEVTVGLGDCSVPAALTEAAAVPQSEIRLPGGTTQLADAALPPVTTTVKLVMPVTAAGGLIDAHLTVADGGVLWLEGVGSARVGLRGGRLDLTIHVDGSLIGNAASVHTSAAVPALTIGPTGAVLLDNSSIGRIVNEGTLSLRQSTAMSTIASDGSGSTELRSSIVSPFTTPGCTGNVPTSFGYNSAIDSTCGLTAVGDLPSTTITFDLASLFGPVPLPEATSPLVDHIPPGINGCGTVVATDRAGTPRPRDGNGDGVLGCDIGAGERP